MSGTCFEPCDEIVDSHPRAFTARDVEHDVPVRHHQCAVAERKCLMHVVRDHQAGDVTFRHDARVRSSTFSAVAGSSAAVCSSRSKSCGGTIVAISSVSA